MILCDTGNQSTQVWGVHSGPTPAGADLASNPPVRWRSDTLLSGGGQRASKELGSSHPPALSGAWWGWSFGTYWNKTCSEASGSSSSASLASLPAIHYSISLAGERSVAPLLSTPVQPYFSLPVYSGKQILSGDFLIFSSNMSFLFRNRMIDVSVNHLLLQMLSKSFRDSCMRFCNRKERSHQAKASNPETFNM